MLGGLCSLGAAASAGLVVLVVLDVRLGRVLPVDGWRWRWGVVGTGGMVALSALWGRPWPAVVFLPLGVVAVVLGAGLWWVRMESPADP